MVVSRFLDQRSSVGYPCPWRDLFGLKQVSWILLLVNVPEMQKRSSRNTKMQKNKSFNSVVQPTSTSTSTNISSAFAIDVSGCAQDGHGSWRGASTWGRPSLRGEGGRLGPQAQRLGANISQGVPHQPQDEGTYTWGGALHPRLRKVISFRLASLQLNSKKSISQIWQIHLII